MEVQNPFLVNFGAEFADQRNFSQFIIKRAAHHSGEVALADVEPPSQRWRYGEMRECVDRCKQRLMEIGVGAGYRLALITSTTCRVIFIHLACAELNAIAVCINGWANADEIWHQLDEVECSHAVTETQFTGKVEELRRKALMRGLNRCRVVRTLDEVLGEQKLTRQKRESKTSAPVAKPVEEVPSESRLAQRRKTASVGNSLAASKPATSLRGQGRQRSAASSTYPSRSSSPIPPTPNQTVVTSSPLRRPPSLPTTPCINNNAESHIPAPTSSTSYPAPPVVSQPLMIFFTFSGTSLFPKPVGVPAQGLIRNLLQITHSMYSPAAVGDRVLLPVSIHHLFGTLSMYAALLGGATVYTMPKYSIRGLIAAAQGMKVTRLHLTTNMAQVLMTNGSLKGLTQSLRSVMLGGARFDLSVAKLCEEHANTIKFQQMYVNTEVGGCAALSPTISEAVDNVGWPLPGTVLRVSSFDNTQQLCRPRQLGQLLCAGPQVAPQFFRNSKPVLSADTLVDGRFARTGDVGYYDEHGAIYVLDRQSDIIRYRGTLICPSAVESALRTHTGVADCAVVGRSANLYSSAGASSGELPAAFIVRTTNCLHLSSAEIKHHIGGQMKQVGQFPGGVYFVPEIPRSVGGRIYRRHLKQFCDRERLAGQQSSQDSIPAVPVAGSIPTSQSANGANQRNSQQPLPQPPQTPQRFRRADSIVYIPAPAISRLNGVTVRRGEVHRVTELQRRVTAGSMSSSASVTKSLKSLKGSSSSQLSLLSNNNNNNNDEQSKSSFQ